MYCVLYMYLDFNDWLHHYNKLTSTHIWNWFFHQLIPIQSIFDNQLLDSEFEIVCGNVPCNSIMWFYKMPIENYFKHLVNLVTLWRKDFVVRFYFDVFFEDCAFDSMTHRRQTSCLTTYLDAIKVAWMHLGSFSFYYFSKQNNNFISLLSL